MHSAQPPMTSQDFRATCGFSTRQFGIRADLGSSHIRADSSLRTRFPLPGTSCSLRCAHQSASTPQITKVSLCVAYLPSPPETMLKLSVVGEWFFKRRVLPAAAPQHCLWGRGGRTLSILGWGWCELIKGPPAERSGAVGRGRARFVGDLLGGQH